MKMFLVALVLSTTMPPLLADTEKDRLSELVLKSESAYALATVHIGSFKETRLNSLTNRIQDDQRVILKTLRDTARRKNLTLPPPTVAIPSATTKKEFLRREIVLHERMLKLIEESSSPTVKNMKARIEVILGNARRIEGGSP